MEEKIKFIQDYINQCDEVINSGNYSQAKQLEYDIIGVFNSEINNIENQLDMYSLHSNTATDYIGDIKILKQKLINYQINLKSEAEKQKYDLEMARLKQPSISAHAESNQTQNNTININVSLPDAIRQIEDITENELSSEDKEILKDYMYSLEGIKTTKNKSAFWDKTKGILKFLADKSADAAIAVLPYIITNFPF